MKRLRNNPMLLMAIALALPLCPAFLYYGFYDGNDLVSDAQLSMSDDGDLLNLLKAMVSSDKPLPQSGLTLLETKTLSLTEAGSVAVPRSVLRC